MIETNGFQSVAPHIAGSRDLGYGLWQSTNTLRACQSPHLKHILHIFSKIDGSYYHSLVLDKIQTLLSGGEYDEKNAFENLSSI